MMAPKISVVVPCRNNGPYVAEAIASVVRQSLPVSQIVFVDDASTDDSVEAAFRVTKSITLVQGRFGSCGASRNAGLVKATGNVIAFLDADDVWPQDSVAARYATMQAASAGICFGRVRQTWLEANENAKPVGPDIVGRLAGSMLVDRRVFDRIGGFDESLKVSESIDWASRAVDAGVLMASCCDLVLFRRIHQSNTMRVTENVDRLPLRALRTIVARRHAAGAA